MRPYISPIVVLVALVLLVGIGLVSGRLFESPQAAYSRQTDEKIEQAQRLLAKYEGGQPLLLSTLEQLAQASAEPATRPAASEPATQPDIPAPSAAGGPLAANANRQDHLAQEKETLERHRRELSDRIASLNGEPSETTIKEPGSADELRQIVQANSDLLAKALQSVREAINTSGGEGLSGESHAVATRLEALLVYQQADLKRRQAAVHRALANAEAGAFGEVLLAWHEANNKVNGLETELKGTPGGSVGRGEPTVAAEPSPAPAPKGPAADKAVPPAPDQGSKGLLGAITGSLLNKKSPAAPAPEPTEPTPAPADTADDASNNKTAEPAAADATTVAEPGVAPTAPVAIPLVSAIEARIEALDARGREVDGQIAEDQKEIDRLSVPIKDLQARLEKATKEAQDAEARMMALVDAGVDPADENALDRFKDEYDQAAKTYRAASREAAALRDGAMRNARADAQEENEIITAPLVPTEQGRQITPEPGLTNLEVDMKAAQTQLASRHDLRKLIDLQIKDLKARREQLHGDLEQAKLWRNTLVQEASSRAERASAENQKARELECEAVELLTRDGQSAAQRAIRAAEERSRQVQEFYQQNATPTPQIGFVAGHADATAGDIEFARAAILAQQADGLVRQANLLARTDDMGIDRTKLAAGKPAAAPSSAPASQPSDDLIQLADTARKEALEAAGAAIKHYEDASGKLNRLWTVQTQIAAVRYLMADLKSVEEGAKDRAAALQEYQAATRDHSDQARAYRPIIQALSAQK